MICAFVQALNGALAPPSCEKTKKCQNFQLQSALIPDFPLVERSHLYQRVELDEYYQNIIVKHLDHFWNLTPLPLDEVSGSDNSHFTDSGQKDSVTTWKNL